MFVRVVRGIFKTYKRNTLLFYSPFYSTNKYNNKMEETNQLAAKVETLNIQERTPNSIQKRQKHKTKNKTPRRKRKKRSPSRKKLRLRRRRKLRTRIKLDLNCSAKLT